VDAQPDRVSTSPPSSLSYNGSYRPTEQARGGRSVHENWRALRSTQVPAAKPHSFGLEERQAANFAGSPGRGSNYEGFRLRVANDDFPSAGSAALTARLKAAALATTLAVRRASSTATKVNVIRAMKITAAKAEPIVRWRKRISRSPTG
jgi:hypothetical protein